MINRLELRAPLVTHNNALWVFKTGKKLSDFCFFFVAFFLQSCCRKLRSWIEVAPYQPEQQVDEQDFDDRTNSDGLRVLSCSISPNPDTPAFLAMLDGGGQVTDYLRLKYLLNRRNATRAKEREDKVSHLLCFGC